MVELPTGTVTFLFTDIEGSTTRLKELGAERYSEVLGRHNELLRAAFAANGGVEVENLGDGFFAVFESAGEAVAGGGRRAAGAGRGALADAPADRRPHGPAHGRRARPRRDVRRLRRPPRGADRRDGPRRADAPLRGYGRRSSSTISPVGRGSARSARSGSWTPTVRSACSSSRSTACGRSSRRSARGSSRSRRRASASSSAWTSSRRSSSYVDSRVRRRRPVRSSSSATRGSGRRRSSARCASRPRCAGWTCCRRAAASSSTTSRTGSSASCSSSRLAVAPSSEARLSSARPRSPSSSSRRAHRSRRASGRWTRRSPCSTASTGSTANLACQRPVLILIDDLHWADEPSLRWLAYLVRRLEGLPVLVVVASAFAGARLREGAARRARRRPGRAARPAQGA